jgi:lysophospholipase L1-like esterase
VLLRERSRVIRRRLGALAFGIAAAIGVLLVAEAGVRLAGIEPMDLPTTGDVFWPIVRVDPLLGPLLRPGSSDFTVTADERGFRSTGLPPPEQPQARIAFLGDSCTFGFGVNTPEAFVAQIDALQRTSGAPPFELMNAAYLGQSAVVGVHMLRERILPLHPDLVVLGYSANNAFRFSLLNDVDRFRFIGVRKLLLHSRLYEIVAARLANRNNDFNIDPRDRKAIMEVPLAALKRVAFADEFEDAVRTMVKDARAAGVKVLLLILPRSSEVSIQFGYEDAAKTPPLAERPADGHVTPREIGLLEASCLDHRQFADPIATLHEQRPAWRPMYPPVEAARAAVLAGARAYVRGDFATAVERFTAALALQPDSPLIRYDRGVALIASGQRSEGLQELREADRLACNVFLQYQVLIWKIATELDVPVVDITLAFQAHDGESLFLDPAHPNPAGHRIIAEMLLPAIERLVDKRS